MFRKLAILDAAGCLNDLQIPPGNRLEPLRGNRHGQHRACLRNQCINALLSGSVGNAERGAGAGAGGCGLWLMRWACGSMLRGVRRY
ncbi:MAG: type II toxin-antitoxin system RelE/ParE family toxin [Vulcanococcus sp.]